MRGFTTPRGLLTLGLAALLVLCFNSPLPVHASSSVTDCSTFGPGSGTLADALNVGGEIIFGCSGVIIVPEMFISTDTVIDSAGNDVTLDANNANRHFTVNAGVSLRLHGLWLVNGYGGFREGGGSIYNNGIVDGTALIIRDNTTDAGTVYNLGQMTLTRVNIANNVSAGDAGAIPGGVAIGNSGTLTLRDSTITNGSLATAGSNMVQNTGTMTVQNSSFNDGDVNNGFSGGARDFVPKSGVMQLAGVTISRGQLRNIYGELTVERSALLNSPTHGFSSSAFISANDYTGGIDLVLVGTTTFVNTTIAYAEAAAILNGVPGADGSTTLTNVTLVGSSVGIDNQSGSVNVINTLVANNSVNCTGTVGDSFSLSDDATCDGFTEVTTDALALGALTDGYVPLNTGSAAIDAGDISVCPAEDQRGVARPQGVSCDVGAYEFEVGVTPPIAGVVQCPAGTTQINLVTWNSVLTKQYNLRQTFPLNLSQDSVGGVLVVKSMVGHPEAGCPASGDPLCGDQDNEEFNVLLDNVQTAFVPDHGNDKWAEFSFPLDVAAGTHEITFAHTLREGNNPFGSVFYNAAYCARYSTELPSPPVLTVTGTCDANAGQVIFTLTNNGGAMTAPVTYAIWHDFTVNLYLGVD